MTTKFTHRTSISFQELIVQGEITENDLKDGILSQRLVPSYFIDGEVSEMSLDADGVLKRTSGAFKKELMYLVKPRPLGSFDCDFEFCATTADAIETGAPIFQLGVPGGYVRTRISLTDILDKGVVTQPELQRFNKHFQSIWPWGLHHTTALGHLEAAAKRFWVNYDPSDKTTAETNQTVSQWLQKEHQVSENLANAIATMLRPDDLPPGPRK